MSLNHREENITKCYSKNIITDCIGPFNHLLLTFYLSSKSTYLIRNALNQQEFLRATKSLMGGAGFFHGTQQQGLLFNEYFLISLKLWWANNSWVGKKIEQPLTLPH